MWKIEKIVKKGDYLYCIVRDHPGRTQNDYVLLHRVIMENHLGRLLSPNEVVHHKNGNKKDNSIDNLEVLDKDLHNKLHQYEVGLKMVRLKCPACSTLFDRRRGNTFLTGGRGSKFTACSPRCRGIMSRKIQLQGITPEVEIAISENLVSEYRRYLDDNPEETETTGSVETTRDPSEMTKI